MDWTLLDTPRTATPEFEIAFRLFVATLLAGLFGFDRELKNRDAGLRTHMLIGLAAALFTIVAFEIFHAGRRLGQSSGLDPIRVVEAVTAGVAFLAAGTIIQNRRRVHGLTTGAGMWTAGAIGVACGAGYYTIAVIAVVLGLTVLSLLHWVERRAARAGLIEGDATAAEQQRDACVADRKTSVDERSK
ncbi:MAG: MgtC/SapB family protein [Hyphomicrobiaceae bacterium]